MNTQSKWPAHLVIVRHGESARNVAQELAKKEKRHSYSTGVRDVDTPLTQRGEQQATETGHYLAGRFKFDAVIASPYLRTKETARLIAEQFPSKLKIVEEERIREIEFGLLDALTVHGIRDLYPEEHKRKESLGKYYYRPAGGENKPDVNLRLQSFLATLSREYRGQTVLVVTHSVVAWMFRRLLERLTEENYSEIKRDRSQEVFNCSVSHYACNAESGTEGKLLLKEFNGI